MTRELQKIHDMLTNLGLSTNKVRDDGRINCVGVDANRQPSHQHGPAIQRMQLTYEDESNEGEEEGIMDYHKSNQRRGVGAIQP